MELAVFIKNSFTDARLHSTWKVYYEAGEKAEKKVKQFHVRINLCVNISVCPDDEIAPIKCNPHNDCDEKDYVFDIINVTETERYIFMQMLVNFCNKNKIYFYNSILYRKYWTTSVINDPTVEVIRETEKKEMQLSNNNINYMVRHTYFHDDCIYAKLIRFIK